MRGTMAAKYAFRSIFRHARRTILSIMGVGIGCGLGLFAISWIIGEIEWQIKAVAQSGGGHVKVVPAGWIEKREELLRLADWQKVVEQVRAIRGVESFAVRSKAKGLLAFGNRSAGVEITGVQPDNEPAVNRIVRYGKLDGRYLKQGDRDRVVIGAVLARRLAVEVGDDLVLTIAGKNDIKSAMLKITGIVSTGNRDIDLSVCHVTMEDLDEITGCRGAGEVTVLLDDYRLADKVIESLNQKLPEGDRAISWQEVKPDLAAGVEGDKAYTKVLVGIIILIVTFGIASAQLTSVLERHREFAILMALGMKIRQVVALIMMESILIGLGGAVVGMLLGGGGAYYISTAGVNFESIIGNLSVGGDILIDKMFYGDFGPWLVWVAMALSLGATIVASIYPAWYVAKSDPASALRTV